MEIDMAEQYRNSRKRGCPTCGGIDPKSCMRCKGITLMKDWWRTDNGWQWGAPLSQQQKEPQQ